jgi:hypothetical protein
VKRKMISELDRSNHVFKNRNYSVFAGSGYEDLGQRLQDYQVRVTLTDILANSEPVHSLKDFNILIPHMQNSLMAQITSLSLDSHL